MQKTGVESTSECLGDFGENSLDGAVDGTSVGGEDMGSGGGDGVRLVGGSEKVAEGGLEGAGVCGLERSAIFDEVTGELGEVLHVWAEEDWLSGDDGFNRVLSSSSQEAFSNDDDIRDGEPILQFTCGVDDERVAGWPGQGSAPDGDEWDGGKVALDFTGSLKVSGRDEIGEIWKVHPEPGNNLADHFFFSRMGAAGEKDGGVGGFEKNGGEFPEFFHAGGSRVTGRVELHGASAIDVFTFNSERRAALDVVLMLDECLVDK